MERFKGITIILLLAFAVLASAAQTKPASVLLQEGLYAEQIEGNLDAAIRIYRQVIAESEEMQQTAAQATYRIAICYLKKGEKAEAARKLRNILSKFPQQQSLIKEAQKQLAKLEPNGVKSFGPVIERILYTDETGKDCLFDLDTGKAFSLPEGLTRYSAPEEGIPWILENGIDFLNCAGRLQLWDMVAVEVEEEMWDSAGAVEITSALMKGSSKEFLPTSRVEYTITTPRTYAFKTREGGVGLLQIVEKRDTYLRIRYKMLQEAEKTARTEVLGPVIERVMYSEATGKPFFFDLDTGQAFYPPPGLTRHSPERQVIEWSATKGIDFVNDRGRLELVQMTTVKVASSLWESATRAEIRDALMKGSTKKVIPTHSKDYTISSPITYAFETRENGLGVLQILEKEDENIRIRYKMLQQKPDLTAREIFLPDADTKGVGVVLDLASGELLDAGKGDRQLVGTFAELGKGDLAWDRVLICLRGATAKVWKRHKRDKPAELKIEGRFEDATAYKLRSVPFRVLVTTAEGKNYDVTVIALHDHGMTLKYVEAKADPDRE